MSYSALTECNGPEDILRVLREDLAKAKEQTQIASEQFGALIKDSSGGLPDPECLRSASIEYSQALTRMIFAMSRLNAFAIHGRVPEDLKHL